MNQESDELARKIREAQQRQRQNVSQDPAATDVDKSESGKAFRAGTDLVAALAVGIFLGYWVDQWLGSKPWGLIFFVFLGFAAGFLNIYRSQTGQDYKVGFRTETPKTGTNETDKPDKEE